MDIELKSRIWKKDSCAVFCRSRDRYGRLSNMTGGFPLEFRGLTYQGPEGLYQALKFPHRPDAQREIAEARSGMDAKKVAYGHRDFRPDWDSVKPEAMALTLALKLQQHPEKFGAALRETGKLDIVELSVRDAFWGAKPEGDTLRGVNALGQLLTKLRDLHAEDPATAARKMAGGCDLKAIVA